MATGQEQRPTLEAEGGPATCQKGQKPTIEDMERTDRLVTVDELATYLGVPVATLYQWPYRQRGTTRLPCR